MYDLEADIGAWRDGLHARGSLTEDELSELEGHLRDEVEDLSSKGLSPDEAFLVAMKRLGQVNVVAGEYARARGTALWRQFTLGRSADGSEARKARAEVFVVAGLALLAGCLALIFSLAGGADWSFGNDVFMSWALFFLLPSATAFLSWRRGFKALAVAGFAALSLASGLFLALAPWTAGSDSRFLAILGIDLALILALALPFSGKPLPRRDDLIPWCRLAGETFIFTCLLWAGSLVTLLFAAFLIDALGGSPGDIVMEWMAPILIFASPVLALWLADSKRSVVQNLAPILARIFIIPFVLLIGGFLAALALGAGELSSSREVLIGFDALLAMSLGLLLYTLSSMDDKAGRGFFDWACLALALLSLIADGVALWAMGARILEWGGSPNKVAALGMNIVLLVNLGGMAVYLSRRLFLGKPLKEALSFQAVGLYLIGAWLLFQSFVLPLIYRFA